MSDIPNYLIVDDYFEPKPEKQICTRGNHYCQNVCPDAFGVPCSPPDELEFS